MDLILLFRLGRGLVVGNLGEVDWFDAQVCAVNALGSGALLIDGVCLIALELG